MHKILTHLLIYNLLITFMISYHSLLKIWNLNKCGGVVGIFNCQGTGSWPGLESNAEEDITFELSGKVSPSDIEYFEEVSTGPWTQDCAVFRFNTGMVSTVLTVQQVHAKSDMVYLLHK